jgi:hypothetical protein
MLGQPASPCESDHNADDESDEPIVVKNAAKKSSRAAGIKAKRKSYVRSGAANKSAGASDEAALLSCLGSLSRLPKNSAYARHRHRVVSCAIRLLRINRFAWLRVFWWLAGCLK